MTETNPISSVPSSATAVGSVVAGRYRLTRLIGEGGMGAVYEAEHVEIGKRVAIKLVRSVHARHAEIAARFKREARSASAIESDHIVQVFDAGHDPELGLFMAMELLRGEDLGTLLHRVGRLDVETACSVALQAAAALERAHAAAIVHRDLKPANIYLVEREDQTALVKLVDFGIAKIVRESESGGGLTRTGSAIGTPNYMSPEQAQGLQTLDHRTDIYSLGAVLHEMIAGTPPFPEMPSYEQTILQILTTPAPRCSSKVPGMPPFVDQLIADMMAFHAAQRIGTMREVRERIMTAYPGLDRARLLLAPSAQPAMSGMELRLSTRPASGPGMVGTAPGVVFGTPPAVAAGTAPGIARGASTGRTNVGVTLDSPPGAPGVESLTPQGVPKRGSVVAAVVLTALLATAAVAGVIAWLRSHSQTAPPAQAAVGLVTSVMQIGPPPPAPPPPPPPATASAEPAPAQARQTPVASAAPAESAKPAAAKHTAGKHTTAKATAEKPPPPAKEKPPRTGTPVGGTGISDEF
jgi:eukaryotic-like serine/threonine-protein kinase